jgi:putative ABC transport system permease protein
VVQDTLYFILRDVWRSFKSDKLTVAFALASMAIGLAMATVTLSILDATILHPLPYPAPQEIVELTQPDKSSGRLRAFTYRFFQDAQRSLPGIQSLGALSYSDLILQSDHDPVAVSGVACSASFFDVLKLKPMRGRSFERSEESPDSGVPVVLISEELWRNRYGSDPGILGRTIRLNELPHIVIGVMKAGLRIPPLPSAPAVWIPLGSDPMMAQVKKMFPSSWDRSAYLFLWARINPGISVKTAEEQAKAAGLSLLAQADPDRSPSADFRIVSVEEQLRSRYQFEIYILVLGVLLIMLVTCFNVSSLILARSLSHRGELAVRLALGESQLRAVTRMFLEGVLISVSGALAAMLAGKLMLLALESTIPSGFLPYREITLSTKVLGMVLTVAVVCGIVISLWPALRLKRSGRGNLLESLHRSTTEGRSVKLNRQIVVVAQIACTVLAIAIFLSLFRSYHNISAAQLGFDAGPVLVVNLSLPKNAVSGARWKQLGALLINNLESQNGVASAAIAISPPLTRSLRASYSLPGSLPGKGGQNSVGIADYRPVGRNYFSTLGIPLRKGRLFSDSDTLKSNPVCILNEALARAQFAERPEIGAAITPLGMKPCEVIGVVGDVASYDLRDRHAPALYVPFDQMSSEAIQGFMSILIRTSNGASHSQIDHLKALVVEEIRREAPMLPATIQPLTAIVARASSLERFRAMLMGVVSLIAVILAACGVYGIAANYVIQRRRDLTIRLALGATTRHIITGIMKDALILAVIGLVLGLAGAYPLLKALNAVLFGLAGLEMEAIAACALIILFIVSLSAYIPARRTISLNVADVLKDV